MTWPPQHSQRAMIALGGSVGLAAAIAPTVLQHLQALDQVVFWHAFATRSVPRKTAALAALTSAAIVGRDVHRRSPSSES